MYIYINLPVTLLHMVPLKYDEGSKLMSLNLEKFNSFEIFALKYVIIYGMLKYSMFVVLPGVTGIRWKQLRRIAQQRETWRGSVGVPVRPSAIPVTERTRNKMPA